MGKQLKKMKLEIATLISASAAYGNFWGAGGQYMWRGNGFFPMNNHFDFYQGNNYNHMGRFFGNDRFMDYYNRYWGGRDQMGYYNQRHSFNQWWPQNWFGGDYQWNMSPAYNHYGNNWMGRSFYGSDRFYDNQYSRSFYGNNNYWMNRQFYGNNNRHFNNFYNNNWMSFGNNFYGQDSFFEMAEQFFWRNSEWNSDNADRVLRSWQGKWDQS